MKLDVFLVFNGNCKDALKFYSEVFNITDDAHIMTYGEAPSGIPEDLTGSDKELICYSDLTLGNVTLMLCDAFPGAPFVVGSNVNLSYSSKDINEINSIFTKLSKDGQVVEDLGETFWSDCYGYLVDKFGIHWHLSTEK